MIQVKWKRFHEDAQIPKQATDFAGGWDVIATEIEQKSNDFVICKLGFGLQPPFNYKITLVPRSSLTSTKWVLQNSPGLGDPDYIHEYQFRFRALPENIELIRTGYLRELIGGVKLKYPEFPYKVGDRIGQIYIEEIIPTEFVEIKELTPMNRLGGYGSTGNN